MVINFNTFQDHLNKKENSALKNDWKRLIKTQECENAIFEVLSTPQKYNTGYTEKEELLDGYKHRITRRYEDYWFKKDIIEKIQEIRQVKKMQRSTEDMIIQFYKEIQALQQALNTTRPQSDPEEFMTILREENGQGYFNFFPEEKKEIPEVKEEKHASEAKEESQNQNREEEKEEKESYRDRLRNH